MKYKIFQFEHSEGKEIVAANNAKEAINFYFTKHQGDSQTNDTVEFGGIKIDELQEDLLTKKHSILNEETGEIEEISYSELADHFFKGVPEVLVTPNY
ncbi:hypothetical protein RKD55_004626 [Rossellomorea marisflavi]